MTTHNHDASDTTPATGVVGSLVEQVGRPRATDADVREVRMPTTLAEAEAMMRVASHWLEAHAPETLRAMLRSTALEAENKQMREALSWYGDEANAIARNVLAKNTSAMMASMQVLALDGGKRAAKFVSWHNVETVSPRGQKG